MSSQSRAGIERGLLHLYDKSALNPYDKKITNFGAGVSCPDLLNKCCKMFEEATSHRMNIEQKTNSFLFQYGATVGSYEFRMALATFLSNAFRDEVLSQNLVVSAGATQGLHTILTTLIDMDGFIFVDEVTYMIALDFFRQFTNLKIIAVPLTENGVNVVELRKVLDEHKFKSKSKMFWGMYYTIPAFHNPTGILFSDETCKEVVSLAREFDIAVVCDDVYNLLSYSMLPPKRLYSYDDINDTSYRGNVISNGTFSKVIAPGIRLGWMECPPRCVELFANCGLLKSGGCVNNYMSGIVASALQLGLAQDHMRECLEKYKERMLVSCSVLREHLHRDCSFTEPSGGYFIWIELPKHIDGAEFNDFCIGKYKVCIIPGHQFSVHGKFRNFIRLSIAFHTTDVLAKSIKKLCDAIKDFGHLK